PGSKCDGMDVLDTHAVVGEALRCAREDRAPQLVEAVTYRYRGHSMADPEEYRSREEVDEWRSRDPIDTFRTRVTEGGVLSDDDVEKLDSEAQKRIEEAVEFAESSPFPDLAALYDDVYVMEASSEQAWWSVDQRSPETHRGEDEREAGEMAQELAEAGAAYAGEDVTSERRSRRTDGEGDQGEGEPADETRDVEGGGD
ncbi:MAG: thiamine pyrophosphate-dependent enzyme, partial [Actinomycetota bacterium]|nr:thiamine pyrophosphate-dependent enzyme [Actinomycetota bacterium]